MPRLESAVPSALLTALSLSNAAPEVLPPSMLPDASPVARTRSYRPAQLNATIFCICLGRLRASRLSQVAPTLRGCEKMGLAPSNVIDFPLFSAGGEVPVPIFSQPLRGGFLFFHSLKGRHTVSVGAICEWHRKGLPRTSIVGQSSARQRRKVIDLCHLHRFNYHLQIR